MPKRTREILDLLPRLRRYALVLARNEPDADDLLQEAFLRAHEHRATLDPSRPVRGWLMSILHNAFIDGKRSQRARARREADFAGFIDTQVPASQEMAVRLEQVRAAFFLLPTEQREALHLIAVEEMSYAEAAALLHIPQGTLMSRLARARAALRAYEDGTRTPLRLVQNGDRHES
ncbi:sigma-70 family RNA polymerase sigma factor [Paracoccus laeviglucosivorans]|uniref:RNA polymerase sigma-70 factor, ECF subfamily n=1 Tax=Paracoccus laeviglucosivorans TaxID=1197861 RepID=A0A521F241_9RHOB|nr:sigma-70 family RNA polymerase sigma factor [Paracoccus laeviglucosivorans]SMO90262.1 RNA polymerase sigma-70 factor, ECF subfamily [Paracoccus laeviglucosivorans]